MEFHIGVGTRKNGIVHIIGPETESLFLGQPLCVVIHIHQHMVHLDLLLLVLALQRLKWFATQCLMQVKPKTMRITINGKLSHGVSKDVSFYDFKIKYFWCNWVFCRIFWGCVFSHVYRRKNDSM